MLCVRGWKPFWEAGYNSPLLVSSGLDRIQFRLHNLLHLPYPNQVGHDIALFLPVEDLLAIEIHFKTTVGTRGQGHGNITSIATKKLVRHPRGGRVMFSSDAIHDINKGFPF